MKLRLTTHPPMGPCCNGCPSTIHCRSPRRPLAVGDIVHCVCASSLTCCTVHVCCVLHACCMLCGYCMLRACCMLHVAPEGCRPSLSKSPRCRTSGLLGVGELKKIMRALASVNQLRGRNGDHRARRPVFFLPRGFTDKSIKISFQRGYRSGAHRATDCTVGHCTVGH